MFHVKYTAIAIAITFAAALVGCGGDTVERFADIYAKGGDKAHEAGAFMSKAECRRSESRRMSLRDGINDKLAADGSAARVCSLDCDGDGQPDPLGGKTCG